VEVHDPSGAPALSGLPGVHASATSPPAPALRQASLVLIGETCPAAWREEALSALDGTGLPIWIEGDAARSTLAFPLWLAGPKLSLAAWTHSGMRSWERELSGDFFRASEQLFSDFLRLVNEVGEAALNGVEDEAFLGKVGAQLAKPELLGLLLKGDYQGARTMALRIIGTTTRSLG
jgi:hypothetical protein